MLSIETEEPMATKRGFSKLKGMKIRSVDSTCINVVNIVDSKGDKYVIETELGPFGLPVLFMRKVTEFENEEKNLSGGI